MKKAAQLHIFVTVGTSSEAALNFFEGSAECSSDAQLCTHSDLLFGPRSKCIRLHAAK